MTALSQTPAQMWAAFALACPDDASATDAYDAWHFCDNRADADELAELVVRGVKRATAAAMWSYEAENEPLPQVGDYSVITDWEGVAHCVIRATSVEIVPFDQVSEEFAAAEGEGDGSLRFWREVHWDAFGREFAELGIELQPDMPVVCQRFEVVFPPTQPPE